MLPDTQLRTLQELIGKSTREELIWMNGYLAGLVGQETLHRIPENSTVTKLTIVYGTDTGNSKKLSMELAARAKKAGTTVKWTGLDQYRPGDLAKEENLLIIISTHGEGEPPAAARKFFDYIHQHDLQLRHLKYAVLALGDTAYPLFCKAGEDVDARLSHLGATRSWTLQKCDVDYEADAKAWFENVMNTMASSRATSQTTSTVAQRKTNGRRTYTGTVLTNVNLNGKGSAKQTHHIEIAVEGVEYLPGDSIGIVPPNPEPIVTAIIDLVGIDAEKIIRLGKEEASVFEWLRNKLNIVYLPERVVSRYASVVKQEIPSTRIDLLNLLKIYPVRDAGQFEEVIGILEPITPRLYSISSSLKAHGGEVHITVARNCFTVNGEVGHGLGSDYLVNLKESTSFEFYIHSNSQFRLPPADADVIMIGPGTGIAPFRSFIEERDASGSHGRNWLFFGDQHFESDFLYQTEIQAYVSTGVLSRINVAFSRDQREKVYVQNKIQEHGEEFFRWIEAGAYVYICGAKTPMSDDVEKAVIQLLEHFGNRTPDEALAYLDKLKGEGRFLKDVY